MTFQSIADYALIGDARSAALISRDGSIDWLCWPRFDSRSTFARILDVERGGYFVVQPSIPFRAKRRYLEDTNVLETTFETDKGIARLIDLMPVMREEEKRQRLAPLRQLLRRIEGIDGSVPFRIVFAPRPDYARVQPHLRSRRDAVLCENGPTILTLRSDVTFALEDDVATASVRLERGHKRYLALAFDSHSPAILPNISEEADEEIDRSIGFWQEWSSQLTYDGPYRDAVLRSALVLKLLTYAPSGAVVAAPTTSLPETIGGVRNWDYRYCWLRDASFTVAALDGCGYELEGGAFVDWLLYATQLTHPRLQILYDVFGEADIPERELKHLTGYRGSSPVRIGNAARNQFQLDVYGEVLGAVEEHLSRNGNFDHITKLGGDVRRLLFMLADVVVKRWSEPDNGIWEKRAELQQHVHAKIMAWAALDSALRLAEKGPLRNGHVDLWRRTKEEIKRVVLESGFNQQLNSFVGVLDGDELDSSVLYASRVGFLPPDDPRVLSTIDAIRKRLGRDELLYRYDIETRDGLPPGEGAFLACSFWMVEALALAGRDDEAGEIFEKLLRRGNDVGLFSEEIDGASGELLGNFPQALTHIGLMNAALCLSKRRAARSERKASTSVAPPASTASL
ncbi:MAG: glycoside hydrolase family 15 protein [Thermoanaerobaculia bacterium]